jgi:hypothetical protein
LPWLWRACSGLRSCCFLPSVHQTKARRLKLSPVA